MTLAISPAAREALDRWLAHLRALDGAAENTIKAYGADVAGYLSLLAHPRGGAEGLGVVPDLRVLAHFDKYSRMIPDLALRTDF